MTYRGPWNAAGLRHRQTPRRYKAVAPVGDHELNVQGHGLPEGTYRYLENGKRVSITLREDRPTWPGVEPEVCPGCKVHVCSCEKPKQSDVCSACANGRTCIYLTTTGKSCINYDGAELFQVAHPDGPTDEAHRAAMQPQGGTAAEWLGTQPPRFERGPGLHCFESAGSALTVDQALARLAAFKPAATSACNHSGIGLLGCELCDPLAKVRQASERVRPVVGIHALCTPCTGKLPGEAHYCRQGECQCAECRAYQKSIGREWVGSASSDLTGGKTRITSNTDSASMTYSQPSTETGINQTQGVMFEGTPLMIGDYVCCVTMPQVVGMVADYETTRLGGLYLTLGQSGGAPVGGYHASRWTRCRNPRANRP